jgi:hypothetical protein
MQSGIEKCKAPNLILVRRNRRRCRRIHCCNCCTDIPLDLQFSRSSRAGFHRWNLITRNSRPSQSREHIVRRYNTVLAVQQESRGAVKGRSRGGQGRTGGILLGDATKATDVKVVGTPFTQEPYGIGTPKQNPEMKKFVDGWLKTIQDAGLWQRLYKLTIGKVVAGDVPTPPQIGSVPGS